jgi:hypothetical protein
VAGLCFSPVSCTNKTDRNDIAKILLKVALNTINQPTIQYFYNSDFVFPEKSEWKYEVSLAGWMV